MENKRTAAKLLARLAAVRGENRTPRILSTRIGEHKNIYRKNRRVSAGIVLTTHPDPDTIAFVFGYAHAGRVGHSLH